VSLAGKSIPDDDHAAASEPVILGARDIVQARSTTKERPNALAEDLVHDLGAAGQGRNDLMAIDQFRRSRLVVPG
jgi:hypothetical protein